jgi:hypothetical protein
VNFSVYRKPTFSDAIIPLSSNHPTSHKYAAVTFFNHRLNSFQLQDKEYKQEANTIQNILLNNSLPLTPQTQTPAPHPTPQNATHKAQSGPPSHTLDQKQIS